MALVESLKIPLGTKMPSFDLKDPFGKSFNGDSLFKSNGLLVAFLCNHCPYAVAVWPRFVRLADHAEKLNVGAVAINPNIHPDYPEDAPEKMKGKLMELLIQFPYLVDETQQVAKSFKAQCTPDIYLFNKSKELVYHGRIDDNWQNESAVKRQELKEALENMASGKPIDQKQMPAMGCSIKWRS